MFLLVASFAVVEAITLSAAFWFYRRQTNSVPAKDYEQLAASYLDALLEVVRSNVRRNSCDELDPLS